MKVRVMAEVPPPHNLRQLQSVQGKIHFLRHFVPNYATQAQDLLHLLRQDLNFKWDAFAQQSFDALKRVLSTTPLISPPAYD